MMKFFSMPYTWSSIGRADLCEYVRDTYLSRWGSGWGQSFIPFLSDRGTPFEVVEY